MNHHYATRIRARINCITQNRHTYIIIKRFTPAMLCGFANGIIFVGECFFPVQGQFIASCPDYSVSYHGSCYIFGFGQRMLFHEADKFCRNNHGGHVVEVNTKNESSFLKNYMTRLPRTENYWLGMTDEQTEHSWRWFNSDTQVTMFDWAPGDPDNVATDEDCAVFWNARGYTWADVPCGTFKAEPVCELSLLDETEVIG